jgi:hypothetical protein
LSLDEVKGIVLKDLYHYVDIMLDFYVTEDFLNFTELVQRAFIRDRERIASWINKGWIRDAAYRLLPFMTEYDERTGIYYIDDDSNDLDHDMFRTREEGDVMLLSLKETLEYVEKNLERITLSDDTFARIEAFWKKHPDGCITFG